MKLETFLLVKSIGQIIRSGVILLFAFWFFPFKSHSFKRRWDQEEDKRFGREKHPGWCW